jgi:hypothetical protein
MSALQAVLDRLNDIEATIERVSREAKGESPFAFRMALKSLENRRADLREELAEITRRESIDVCDYRLIPEGQHSRAISGIATALNEFQNLVAAIYDCIVNNRPKENFHLSADVWEKTRLDFGFTYAGSLGVVMTIPNERLLLIETELDQSISVVFELPKIANYEELREVSEKYGHATIRKLHEWSKAHRDYLLAAEIRWIRDRDVRRDVFAQPQEMEHVCSLIEGTSEEKVDPVSVTGQLTAFSVPSGF